MKKCKIKPHAILLSVVLLAAGTINADMQPTLQAAGDKKKPEVKIFDIELYPVKQATSQNLRLLPDPNELQVNAVDLYNKALSALPKKTDRTQFDSVQHMTVEDFNINKAKRVLKKYQKAINLAAHAGRCEQCKWPTREPTMEPLSKYKTLARAIALKARMQIVQGQYDQALDTIQTGMAISRNLGWAPTIIEGLVGLGIGGTMCAEIRSFLQQPDTPCLYDALDALPEPFIDLNTQINSETENLKKQYKNPTIRNAMLNDLKPAHDKCRLIGQRLSREIAILKCIEAIRLYASSHDSKLPASLADITEIPIPDDPLTGKAFVYKVSGSKATLESVPPAEKGDYGMRFNLTLKKHK